MPVDMHGLCPLLQVYDMPTSVRFYRDLLGFEVLNSFPARSPDDCDWVWLKQGETELMLNTAYDFDRRPTTRDTARVAGHDDIGLFIGCPDVDAAFRYLHDNGLDLKPPKVQPYA
jgi:catechol 2,3-dioxygenase-like lactoylglutathione lyase family enzyme